MAAPPPGATGSSQPPPAEGVRLEWLAVPERVRAAVEQWLESPVVAAQSQPTGFSPGVAARLRTADGRRVFAKAAGPVPNPDVPSIHRREARIVAALRLSHRFRACCGRTMRAGSCWCSRRWRAAIRRNLGARMSSTVSSTPSWT